MAPACFFLVAAMPSATRPVKAIEMARQMAVNLRIMAHSTSGIQAENAPHLTGGVSRSNAASLRPSMCLAAFAPPAGLGLWLRLPLRSPLLLAAAICVVPPVAPQFPGWLLNTAPLDALARRFARFSAGASMAIAFSFGAHCGHSCCARFCCAPNGRAGVNGHARRLPFRLVHPTPLQHPSPTECCLFGAFHSPPRLCGSFPRHLPEQTFLRLIITVASAAPAAPASTPAPPAPLRRQSLLRRLPASAADSAWISSISASASTSASLHLRLASSS